MITRILLITALVLSNTYTVADTRLVNVEEAAEVMTLRIDLKGPSMGVVYARMCDQCDLMRLELDNATLIRQGGSFLSLKQAAEVNDHGATIMFDPATKVVTRVNFWK